MTTKKFNGHKNWNHWNVALWIANDEPLYRLALGCLDDCGSPSKAAARMLEYLPAITPDGAPYTHTSVTAALRGLR